MFLRAFGVLIPPRRLRVAALEAGVGDGTFPSRDRRRCLELGLADDFDSIRPEGNVVSTHPPSY